MSTVKIVSGFLALLIGCSALASNPGAVDSREPDLVIPLWPGVAPGSEGETQVEKQTPAPGTGDLVTRNVVKPTLSVYLPSEETSTGIGIIVAPGGGFRILSMDTEGHDVARWLVKRGIAAFVLKYRLVETPESDQKLWAEMAEWAQAFAKSKQHPRLDKEGEAGIADGIRATELVHKHAGDWGVREDRVGFMGFSAGAVVASHVALTAPEEVRPDFAAPIYGAPFGEPPRVTSKTPPFFLAYASNDAPVIVNRVQTLYTALRSEGHHPELHIYRNGGHGFGMRQQGLSSDFWINDFYNWLRTLEL